MEKAKFTAILPFICADLANMISKEESISEEEAISSLYASDLYAQLEREETKLWQYSTPMLYQMYRKSMETGKIQYPDI